MKKYCFTFLSVFSAFQFLSAQITITQDDLPSVGDQFDYIYYPGAGVPVGASGANVTWNYTTYFTTPTDTTDWNFVNPSATPHALHFPDANMAVYSAKDTIWFYLVKNTSGLFITGAFIEKPMYDTTAQTTPDETVIKVPMNYGDTLYDSTISMIYGSYFGYPAYVKSTKVKGIKVDGWGMLQLPGGTSDSTLRVKSKVTQIDSIFVNSTGTYTFFTYNTSSYYSYEWLAKDIGLKMTLETDPSGTTVTSASFVKHVAFPVGVTNENNAAEIHLYPNPASGIIHISGEKPAGADRLEILDMTGKVVSSISLKEEAGFLDEEINTSGFVPGVYIYRINSNGSSMSGRFTVIR